MTPADLVIVPREPTEAMLECFWHGEGESREMKARMYERGRRIWRTFLAAAPSLHEGEGLGALQATPSVPAGGKPETEGLLPCPFCGGEAEVIEIEDGENAGGSCVACTRCQASSNVEFGYKENFRENWNRRAALSHTEEPSPPVVVRSAHEEAEERYELNGMGGIVDGIQTHRRVAFVAGAEWEAASGEAGLAGYGAAEQRNETETLLIEALRPFAEIAQSVVTGSDYDHDDIRITVKAGDLRRVRDLLPTRGEGS